MPPKTRPRRPRGGAKGRRAPNAPVFEIRDVEGM
ncbi:hypothetical protein KIPB_012583, partial [Kipferlia bialata]|eukprot:g12583.t1